MRFFAVVLVLLSVFYLGFDLLLFFGYSYGNEISGWTMGTGLYQQPFGADIMTTFQIGTPTNLAFNVNGSIPIFKVGDIEMGPVVAYVHQNFSGEWKDFSWVGAVVERWTDDYHARIALLYPVNGNFEFSRDLMIDFRYYLKPPKGYVFKDKLLFDISYIGGLFRFGIGLLEPIP